MLTVTAEIFGTPQMPLTKDDLLGEAVSTIDQYTMLDDANAKNLARGHVSIKVRYQALNLNEAETTLEHARKAVSRYCNSQPVCKISKAVDNYNRKKVQA